MSGQPHKPIPSSYKPDVSDADAKLLRDLVAPPKPPEDAISHYDLCAVWGCTLGTAKHRIDRLIKSGHLIRIKHGYYRLVRNP